MVKSFKRFVVAGLVASMMVSPAAAGLPYNVMAEGLDGVLKDIEGASEKHTAGDADEHTATDADEKYDDLENGDYTYKFSELQYIDSNTSEDMSEVGSIVTVNEDGSVSFDFTKQYGQAYFKLPKGIDPRRVTKIEFVGADTTNFSVKVLPAPGDDSLANSGGVTYGSNVLSPKGLSFKYFGAMTTAGSGGKYSATSVVITLGDAPEEEVDGEVITKKLSELLVNPNGTDEDGNKLVFNSNYQSVFFEIPDEINPALLSKIEIKGDANTFSYKVMSQEQYDDEAEKYKDGLLVSYGNPVLGNLSYPSAKYFIIMCGDTEPYGSFSLDSEVEFTVEASKEIQTDIPDLKSVVVSDETGIGSDAYMGTCIGQGSMKDEKLVALVKKHFNAVTLENELKPEAMLKSSILSKELVDFKASNGLTIQVPAELNFDTPDSMLDQILVWNEDEGVDIKVRGHVLTWHSQTPEWFFREGYDEEADRVSPDVMSARHEWYIKSVIEHYFREGSKYRDLFYGFDVVNEACSDGSGTYRSAQENSPWAAIYGTGEWTESEKYGKYIEAPDYILNAFRFANKYAHECGKDDLELYYNDYNDCSAGKVSTIESLLKSVKSHESDAELPTRITGFGMQGHHEIDLPTKEQITECAAKYGAIVDKVQVTELDVKSSKGYDGSKAMKEAEYTRTGHRYKNIYQAYLDADAMDGFDVNGFTVWGTIDSISWLNDFNGAGGGADGRPQSPLLFDGNYQAKPAYWGIVDPSKLDAYINTIDIIETNDEGFDNGNTYDFNEGDLNVAFTPVWNSESLLFNLQVSGLNIGADDSVTVYTATSDADIKSVEVKGSEFKDGKASVKIPGTFAALDKIKFDVVAKVGSSTIAYNDTKLNQATSSKYYAEANLKPYALIKTGKAEIDGKKDEIWDKVEAVPLTINLGAAETTKADAKLLWDDVNLYLYMDVKDDKLNKESGNAWEQDSVEVFIDENNAKSGAYEDDDKQFRINFDNEQSFGTQKHTDDALTSATAITDDGYVVEAAFKWTDVEVKAGDKIGIELQVNDANDKVGRDGTLSWYDTSGQGYQNTGVFGTATLSADIPQDKIDNKEDDKKQDPTKTDTSKEDNKKVDTKTEDTKKPAASSDSKDIKEVKKIKKLAKGAVEVSVDQFIISSKTSASVKGATTTPLKPQVKTENTNKATITWTKVKGAKEYVVYGGLTGKTTKYTKLGTTTKNTFTAKNLKKGKQYSYMVVAYDKNGKMISASTTINGFTKGGKYTDVSKVKLTSKSKVVLKKGKKSTIKVTLEKADKKLKLKSKSLKYVSSNSKVVTVNSKGKITAKKKGKATIYVIAKNGKLAKVTVTVK